MWMNCSKVFCRYYNGLKTTLEQSYYGTSHKAKMYRLRHLWHNCSFLQPQERGSNPIKKKFLNTNLFTAKLSIRHKQRKRGHKMPGPFLEKDVFLWGEQSANTCSKFWFSPDFYFSIVNHPVVELGHEILSRQDRKKEMSTKDCDIQETVQ